MLKKGFEIKSLIMLFVVMTFSTKASFMVDGVSVNDLGQAFKQAKSGSVIEVGEGKFEQAGFLDKNNVVIRGVPGKTIFYNKSVKGKALFVVRANDTVIENIECYGVSVSDGNGACIRLEGKNLTLKNVYFHDSQQGILTGSKPGLVQIISSRFENLGKAGRAHGIYIGGGRLYISKSFFLSSKDEGHEIKSRAIETTIERTVIASLEGNDSRLVDIPNGGKLKIIDSVLEQGPKSVNWNLIGYGLEGYRYKENSITLIGNIFILEREKGNKVLELKNKKANLNITQNAFIGRLDNDKFNGSNYFFDDRKSAGLEAYPTLPEMAK